MLKLELEAENYQELLKTIKDIIPELTDKQQKTLNDSIEKAKDSAKLNSRPNKKATSKKKTSPKKKSTQKLSADEKPSETKDSEMRSEETSSSKTPDVDKDTVKDYLQKVTTLQGMDAARKLLAKYKARKISDLKPDQYGPIYLECREEISKPETEVY